MPIPARFVLKALRATKIASVTKNAIRSAKIEDVCRFIRRLVSKTYKTAFITAQIINDSAA